MCNKYHYIMKYYFLEFTLKKIKLYGLHSSKATCENILLITCNYWKYVVIVAMFEVMIRLRRMEKLGT